MNPATDQWIITQREKLKYQEQFKALQPQNGFVTGAQAKGFFLQSQLPALILGQIWALADTDSDGKMNINEFSIACKLINLKLRGMDVPKALPPTLLASLASTVGSTPTMTPTGGSMSPLVEPLKQQQTTVAAAVRPAVAPGATAATLSETMPSTVTSNVLPAAAANGAIGMPQQMPLVGQPMMAAPMVAAVNKVISPPSMESKIGSLPATPTPPQSNPPSRHMSISERAPSIESPQVEWAIKGPAKLKYTQVFNATDRTRSGYLTGVQARAILVQSKLPQSMLATIWTLSDIDCDGRLSCDEFILAMFLCDKAMSGEEIPPVLPMDWVPPSFRKIKSRAASLVGPGSRTGSTQSSRHASISSQGGAVDGDPAAGLPQTSFEDKRKENFDKGQAELDRRRKLLQDQQRKEKEERERKEREEAEKREKARLEAERKQQEELERQLQKQREVEMEKEEQRKRELEAKEAARKELEKQRQQEWEQARIAEMNAQKQREQERVLKLKAHNTQLNVELSTLNERIKDLSQKICDTRAGVTNVKSVIDGMRSQRDTSMSEMSQLKTRIKEQNAKLLQLTQERAKWDAKVKAAGTASGDNAQQQEQFNAAFSNKQLIITQLKDKVGNVRKQIETKMDDISSNDLQVDEVKGELSNLITKCEELYTDYDAQRTHVLELKYNKRNDSASVVAATSVSSWDTSATSAWGSSVGDSNAYATAETMLTATTATTAATAPMTNLGDASVVDTSGPAPEGFVKYRSIYEFSARNADEISFTPGDVIFVPLEQNAEPGWLAGEINGHTGWFPETYVEKMDEVLDSTTAATTTITTTNDHLVGSYPSAQDSYNIDQLQSVGADVVETANVPPPIDSYNGDVEYYIAAYPYESNEGGDLSFGAGEMIMVTKKEGEWWTGTIGIRSGMFPSNYVQKADVGSATANATATATDAALSTFNDQKLADNNDVTTDVTEEVTSTALTEETVQQETVIMTPHKETTDEGRTLEDLDIEVSQINTQSKAAEQTESYSRPMSRTSSMTPGMRAKRSEIAQVIAPYEATSTGQLSLTRGQLIMIRKKTDSGWWEGELQAKGRRRQIGWFPATYVKVLQGGRNSGRNTPVSGSRIEMTEQILDKVIALYPYKAQNDDELSFEKDDIISVLGREEPEWWRGELNGLTGLFPSNYVGPFVTSGKRMNGK